MTRRRVLCGLLLASVVLACFAGWLWVTAPRVTRERFEQVKKGMSQQQVIRTVGRSWESMEGGKPPTNVAFIPGGRYPERWWWATDDRLCQLMVEFDDAGTAVEVEIHVRSVPLPKPPTLIEEIRRWLGL
jgi:hypothetical protein